jgi:NAD(P)-dependent dehydrogenase (short-subunit alcohol dehydrogenase family)
MAPEDRVAIVTDAARGIGQALALGFARAGAFLVIIARNSSELAGVEREVLLWEEKSPYGIGPEPA